MGNAAGAWEGELAEATTEWNGEAVRAWLAARIVAARSEQVTAEKAGWARRDDCDLAAAEEMVCALINTERSTADAKTFTDALRALLDRDDYVHRGVYDDTRFDRHVRAYIRKLIKMTKTNTGFGKIARYQ
jgi:hypothetical protein